MGSAAAIVIDNQAEAGTVAASSQELTMPAANLLTPHVSQRWRSLSSSAFFVLDKGALRNSDTVMVGGLTCSAGATVRLRLSSVDSTGAAGDIVDTGDMPSGSRYFDADYCAVVLRLAQPNDWRYLRFDITDPGASFVEAGTVVDGLSDVFDYNFVPGASIQHIDRSRIAGTAAGLTLTWKDNTFRRADLNFEWVTAVQRYGFIERLDRFQGRHKNVLLITEPDSENLPRASIFGLVTDLTPITFGAIPNIFGKQLRIDERL